MESLAPSRGNKKVANGFSKPDIAAGEPLTAGGKKVEDHPNYSPTVDMASSGSSGNPRNIGPLKKEEGIQSLLHSSMRRIEKIKELMKKIPRGIHGERSMDPLIWDEGRIEMWKRKEC